MLIKKMLELLKKYGCEFCDRRFDTKFALSHHERCRSSCFSFFPPYSETSFWAGVTWRSTRRRWNKIPTSSERNWSSTLMELQEKRFFSLVDDDNIIDACLTHLGHLSVLRSTRIQKWVLYKSTITKLDQNASNVARYGIVTDWSLGDLYENVHMMTNCVWQGVQGQLQFEEPRTLPLLQDIRPTHTTGKFDQNSSDVMMYSRWL